MPVCKLAIPFYVLGRYIGVQVDIGTLLVVVVLVGELAVLIVVGHGGRLAWSQRKEEKRRSAFVLGSRVKPRAHVPNEKFARCGGGEGG